MIGGLIQSLTKQVASKSEELRQLNNLVDNMQVLFWSIWSYYCILIALEEAILTTLFAYK